MSDIAVKLEQVSKHYKLYDSPKDRFKEALDPFRRRRYREFFALNHIDLEIKKGEILGVVGRNGSGKSTLLKLIAGVIPPSSGRLTVNGNVSAMLELGSGLNPDLNGIQNIFFGGIMLGFSPEEMKAKADEIIAFAEIGDFINQPLKTYSSGMKARLGFALAISIKPEVLVVDEVLSVGDDLFKRKCFAKMEELFKSGCTVLFVSHSTANVIEICKRAILIDKGELILDGSPKLVTTYYLKYLYAVLNEQKITRQEILQLNRDEEKKKEFAIALECAETPKPQKKTDVIPPDKTTPNPRQQAFYIPDFTPKSTVITKNSDIDIYDFQVTTLDGQKVNALIPNEEYIYSYKVKFVTDIPQVNFGMGFKNEKGLALSWMIYPGIDQYVDRTFYKNENYCVNWRFKCLFTPGTFYIDSGLRTTKNGAMTILVKISDAVAFKVLNNNEKQKGGIFDSICDVEIKKI